MLGEIGLPTGPYLPKISVSEMALLVANNTPAIMAYIDNQLHYRFANSAYADWFGLTPEVVLSLRMPDVLGPIFEQNLPYTLGALSGKAQTFEREVVTPSGIRRFSLMTYLPDMSADGVRGFFVHVVDVSSLKSIQFELQLAQRELEVQSGLELTRLQEHNSVLERLAEIGKEITANLDFSGVFGTLNRHFSAMYPGLAFSLYVLNSFDKTWVHLSGATFSEAAWVPSNPALISIAEQRPIYCSESEVFESFPTGDASGEIFAPLFMGTKCLGLIHLKGSDFGTIAKVNLLVLNAICSYGAIALNNASAYKKLHLVMDDLATQSKMAALGSLVAGMAHEMNTPIGNCLLAISSIVHETKQLRELVYGAGLSRSKLVSTLDGLESRALLIEESLSVAAKKIEKFKEIAVDGTNEESRRINLKSFFRDLFTTLGYHHFGIDLKLQFEIADDLTIVSYPIALARVISQLAENVKDHAYPHSLEMEIFISVVEREAGKILIEFKDFGVGIGADDLKKIFDPFYTTHMGKGSGGLGLSVCYNTVNHVLNGKISATSRVGEGTSVYVEIPILN